MRTQRRIRVAIADDDRSTVRILSKLLKKQERIDLVGAAATGLEALLVAEDLRPDVLLLDQQMPLASGSSVLTEIRKRELPVKVILMSGHDLAGMWRSAGADAFFAKSDDISELLDLLHGMGS